MTPSETTIDETPATRRLRLLAFAIVLMLAFGYAAHAVLASHGKSATYDEPVHAFSSWLIVNESDFRVNPEHPALWKYVAGLPLLGRPLAVDFADPHAGQIFGQVEKQWGWAIQTLYGIGVPLGDGEALVSRARVGMSLFALALALVVARWSWVWGGPVASILATAMLAFDPNFLAHGALVTNDVAATTFITLAVFLTWRLGDELSTKTAILLALACAAGIGTKFTCLLLGPMVGVPLLYRVFDRAPWPAPDLHDLGGIARRVGAVVGLGAGIGIVTLLLLWPLYQFRDAPTPHGQRFDDRYPRVLLGYNTLIYEQDRNPDGPQLSNEELVARASTFKPGAVASAFFWLTEHHVVPQAWGWGLNYANSRSLIRGSYLMGEISTHGFPTFFPLAVAFKTPTTTLLIALACAVGGISLAARRIGSPAVRWKLVTLLVPPAIYFGVSCASNLNIGLRHVLPIYPPLFVAAGVLIARSMRGWRPMRVVAPLAILALTIETISVFPNYLPFFNLPSGGARGGLALLGDSNLDWGQDLKPLSEWYRSWRAQHPNEPFYLSYFGTVPPGAYRIKYVNAVPGYDFDPRPPELPMEGGVYAVSATHLQGIYSPGVRDAMARLRERRPLAVINDTIYIYELPPAGSTRPATTRAAPQANP